MDDLVETCLQASAALTAADRLASRASQNRDLLGADWYRFRHEFYAAGKRYGEALAAVRKALAKEHGWRVSKRAFYLDALVPGRRLDQSWHLRLNRHNDCFLTAERPYKRVAVVSHNCVPIAECEAFAYANGLQLEVLPRSWSLPRTHAVLFTRK